jgi:predicted permease
MTEDPLARRVELTGWSTVLLGVVCLALAAFEIAIPVVLRRLDASGALEGDVALTRVREAFAAGAALSAALNGVLGAALVAVGWGVARRARWSHPALTAAAWASIPALLVLAGPGLDPLLAMSDTTAGSKRLLVVVSVVLAVLQAAAVLWFLRFWRRPDVRATFR